MDEKILFTSILATEKNFRTAEKILRNHAKNIRSIEKTLNWMGFLTIIALVSNIKIIVEQQKHIEKLEKTAKEISEELDDIMGSCVDEKEDDL